MPTPISRSERIEALLKKLVENHRRQISNQLPFNDEDGNCSTVYTEFIEQCEQALAIKEPSEAGREPKCHDGLGGGYERS